MILLNHLFCINKISYSNINEIILKRYQKNILNYKIAYFVVIIFCDCYNISNNIMNKKINDQQIQFLVYNQLNNIKNENKIENKIKNKIINKANNKDLFFV